MSIDRRMVIVLAGTLAGAACSSSTAPGGGSLAVTIQATGGITPSVTVTGPSGYSRVLTATETLHGLTAGSYSVAATTGVVAGPVVNVAYAAP